MQEVSPLLLWSPDEIWSLCVKRYQQTYGHTPEKLCPSRPSKSFKVIGSEAVQSGTYNFLSVIHNNCASVSYYFQLRPMPKYWSKKKKQFSLYTSLYLLRVLIVWNFRKPLGLRKQMMTLQPFRHNPQLDRQTDLPTDRLNYWLVTDWLWSQNSFIHSL